MSEQATDAQIETLTAENKRLEKLVNAQANGLWDGGQRELKLTAENVVLRERLERLRSDFTVEGKLVSGILIEFTEKDIEYFMEALNNPSKQVESMLEVVKAAEEWEKSINLMLLDYESEAEMIEDLGGDRNLGGLFKAIKNYQQEK